MTVAQIKEMIKDMNNNDKVKFVGTKYDRDGYPNDCFVDVNYIVTNKAKLVKDEYGCYQVVEFD